MKPMLKAAFFSLVNDLLARGVTPELKVSTLTSYGSIKWTEGDSTRVEELYSVRDCSPLTASYFRKRFIAWFAEIMAAYHAAAAEELTMGQKVMDGDTVRTVTLIHSTYTYCPDGSKKSLVRTGVIVLDDKIEAMAGDVKPLTESMDEMHALALELDALIQRRAYADEVRGPNLDSVGQRNRQRMWENTWSYAYRVERLRAAHVRALEEDATFEENMLFLASRDMADIWHKHTATLKQTILRAAYREAQRVAQNINDMIDIEVPAHTAMAIAFENLHEHDKAHAEALAVNASLELLKEPKRINER